MRQGIVIGIASGRPVRFMAKAPLFKTPVLGPPIEIKKWLKENGEEGRKAVRALTQEVEKRLKSVFVHLDEPEWEPLLEDLEVLIQTDSPAKSLRLRKQIADAMNYFLTADRPRAEAMAAEMQLHRDAVQSCGLTIKSLVLQSEGIRLFGQLFGRVVGLLVGLLPAVLGIVFHFIPFVIVRLIASRVTPPGRTAVSFNRLLAGLPVYALWYIGAGLWAGWMNVPAWIIALTLLLMPLAGVIALTYWPHAWQSAKSLRQLLLLLRSEKCRKLRQDRNSLRTQLIAMADEYAQRDGQ